MKPFAPTGSFPRLTQLLMVLIGGQIPALTYSLLRLLRRAGDVVRRLACEQTITDVFAANNGIAPCTSGCPFVGVYPPHITPLRLRYVPNVVHGVCQRFCFPVNIMASP